jgi:hypothetical protein
MIAYLRRQLNEIQRSIANRRFATALDACSRAHDACDHLEAKMSSLLENLSLEFTEKALFYDITMERMQAARETLAEEKERHYNAAVDAGIRAASGSSSLREAKADAGDRGESATQ